jgi:hypothetical protein
MPEAEVRAISRFGAVHATDFSGLAKIESLETRVCYDERSVPHPHRRNIMSKGMDSKKSEKKDPAKTMKEKKAEKKIKKAGKK